MRGIFHRNLATPALMGMGALAMLGGELATGGWFYGLGFMYWWVAGLAMRRRPPAARQRTSRSPKAGPVDVVRVNARSGLTDGARGALSARSEDAGLVAQ